MSRVCRACGSTDLERVRPSTLEGALGPDSVRVTNADYGRTGALDRCRSCGLLQCLETGADQRGVLACYQDMQDPGYEESARQRALQERALLKRLARRSPPPASLLDVGAGLGVMVAEAQAMGYQASGVEPSRWLAERGQALGRAIHQGVLPHAQAAGPFDLVTLVDVIEHVEDPVGLLGSIRDILAPHGLGLVVTPNVSSLAARLMGRRWWHFRAAHINYFNRATLATALDRAGLAPLGFGRPGWYFSLSYLLERVGVYLPGFLRLKGNRFTDRVTIPLNLGDSLLAVFTRK